MRWLYVIGVCQKNVFESVILAFLYVIKQCERKNTKFWLVPLKIPLELHAEISKEPQYQTYKS
jgi:hypothetical protein